MAHQFYFAYGSNLDFNQMAQRCPGAEYLGAATLSNHELRMDGAGYATVVPAPGSHVQGALWDLSQANVQNMDRFEGVADGCYQKALVSVRYEGDRRPGHKDGFQNVYAYGEDDAVGVQIDALIYLSIRPPFANYTFRADYLQKVRRGAIRNGLDQTTRAQLSAIAVASETAIA